MTDTLSVEDLKSEKSFEEDNGVFRIDNNNQLDNKKENPINIPSEEIIFADKGRLAKSSRGTTLYIGGNGSNNYTKIQDVIGNTSDFCMIEIELTTPASAQTVVNQSNKLRQTIIKRTKLFN